MSGGRRISDRDREYLIQEGASESSMEKVNNDLEKKISEIAKKNVPVEKMVSEIKEEVGKATEKYSLMELNLNQILNKELPPAVKQCLVQENTKESIDIVKAMLPKNLLKQLFIPEEVKKGKSEIEIIKENLVLKDDKEVIKSLARYDLIKDIKDETLDELLRNAILKVLNEGTKNKHGRVRELVRELRGAGLNRVGWTSGSVKIIFNCSINNGKDLAEAIRDSGDEEVIQAYIKVTNDKDKQRIAGQWLKNEWY